MWGGSHTSTPVPCLRCLSSPSTSSLLSNWTPPTLQNPPPPLPLHTSLQLQYLYHLKLLTKSKCGQTQYLILQPLYFSLYPGSCRVPRIPGTPFSPSSPLRSTPPDWRLGGLIQGLGTVPHLQQLTGLPRQEQPSPGKQARAAVKQALPKQVPGKEGH